MGRVTIRPLLAAALLAAGLLAAPSPTLGFERFGAATADSTYGVEMRFEVELVGGAPDHLELLLRLGGGDGDFVTAVTPAGDRATFRWDAAADHVVPNTLVTYRWRATDGERVTLSQPGELRYEDDRPGFDWSSERIGEATVHWYGDAAGQARRFGELTAVGARQAEELLGHEMAGPVDIFVYADRDDFFGALGPGAREWTGAAAYPHLRTVFMYLGGGSQSYLETAIIHEVTHVVFHDATDNPFHEPARWLNEGIATWSETGDASDERALVAFEARAGGLFAFEAISQQFPLGDRGGRLSYAQGATMVDLIVREHGTAAIARTAAAYREGASDAEALEAGTGAAADELYAAFFAEFDVVQPEPVEPSPMLPSNVERPPSAMDRGPGPGRTPQPPAAPAEPSDVGAGWVVVVTLLAVALGLAAAGAVLRLRRAARRSGG